MAAAFLEASARASGVLVARAGGDLTNPRSRIGEQISLGLGGARRPRGLKLYKADVGSVSLGRFRRNVTVLAQAAAASPVISPELQDTLKRAVAKKAVELVKPGNVVGLGTGSTSSVAIEELGKLIQAGKLKDVVGVATSYQARVLARQFGVKTVDMNDVNVIDIAFDGADEVDRNMNLIKGGGAAHTLEKVVAAMAKKAVILVDQTKVVSQLGLSFPLPVEVLPPAISPVLRSLVAIGGEPEIRSALRKDGPVITDLGNMIVDVRFPNGIEDARALEQQINNIPGVVENGLFVGIVHSVLVATRDGDETTVVELADFVQSLPTKDDAHSLS